MNRLRLGFAVSWAVMLHLMLLLLILLPADFDDATTSAVSAPQNVPSLPILDVRLPARDAQQDVALKRLAVPQPTARPVDEQFPSAPQALESAAAEAQRYEQRLRAYLSARASLLGERALQGEAQLRFEVLSSGQLLSLQVMQADNPQVAAAATELLRQAVPLPRPPRRLQLQVPIRFHG